MKLSKNFGGQGFGNMLREAQSAMAQAETLELELAQKTIQIDKGPVTAVFNGIGEMQKLKIDKSVVDPEDVESLEDLVLSAVRDGFAQATELRAARVSQIMPKIPGL